MAMIVQEKPRCKPITEEDTIREIREIWAAKDLIEIFIEKSKLNSTVSDAPVFEKQKTFLDQLASFDAALKKQFLNYLQEELGIAGITAPYTDTIKFFEFLKNALNKFVIKLKSSDIKILETINLNPLITLEGICSTTKLSWGTVQKRYNQLTSGEVYKTLAVPNYEKLKLVPLLVITTDTEREIHSQYLVSSQKENMWCNTTKLWEILLPKSSLKEGEKIIAKCLQNQQMFEISFITNNVNFTYYNQNNRGWNINWSHWELQLEEQEKVSLPVKEQNNIQKGRKIKKLDLKILSHLTENLRKEQRD
ncbi:MAG: hypothetical protein QXO71_00575, partial [Candidatus Jordarchaeaceae archaeon]